MKLLSSLILISYIVPSMLFSMASSQEPVYCKLADQVRAQCVKKLEKRYQMKMFGTTDGMMDNINLLGFSFETCRSMSKNEAREIVVSCAQEFLKDINANEKIRPYLKSYPFDIKDIDIAIYLKTPTYGTVYHPNLAVVSVYNGKIKYSTNNPLNDNRFLVQETETFEDAVKILNGEIPAPESQIK